MSYQSHFSKMTTVFLRIVEAVRSIMFVLGHVVRMIYRYHHQANTFGRSWHLRFHSLNGLTNERNRTHRLSTFVHLARLYIYLLLHTYTSHNFHNMTSRRDIERLNRILSDGDQTTKPTSDSATQNRAPLQQHPSEVKSSTVPSHSFDMTQKESSPEQPTSSSFTSKNNSIKRTSSSISMASSVEAISIAGSLVDTDAALFAFEYEMLDEVDALCDDQGYANSVSIRNKDEYIEDGRMNKSHHIREESQELILFGIDFSHLPSNMQLMIAAFGVLFFNMLYGYLQELIQIEIAGRCFAFFLGSCQFLGYAFWSWVLAKLRARRIHLRDSRQYNGDQYIQVSGKEYTSLPTTAPVDSTSSSTSKAGRAPLLTYLGLSIIRAIDLGLTNLSMKYLNYPAKTLIKSSRVVFTMMMGLVIGRKKYKKSDYIMVAMLVIGLALFLHADMTTNAVFHPIGVFMLVSEMYRKVNHIRLVIGTSDLT